MKRFPAIGLALWLVLAPLAPAVQTKTSGKKAPSSPAFTLDINRASAADFEKLPGIGPELARRIVRYRARHGRFRRVEDLLAVRGIGLKKWKAMRPHLRIGESIKHPKDD
jgi:competence protein ComEA